MLNIKMRMNKNKKYIVIFFAMKKEYDSFVDVLRNYESIKLDDINAICFKSKNKEFIALSCNTIGKTSSSFLIGRLSQLIDIELIVNIGVAGSLTNTLKPLDIVVANKVAYYDVDLTPFGNKLGQMDNCPLWFEADKKLIEKTKKIVTKFKLKKVKFGKIISGDKFVTNTNFDKSLLNEFENPDLCDMESASIAHCAKLLNISFFIIRSVSDSTIEDKNDEMYQDLVKEASKNSSILLKEVLELD